MSAKTKTMVLWLGSALLAALFLFAGGSKLAGAEMHVQHFQHWGYPDWFRVLIGFLEAAGAVTLLVPRLASIASAVLAVVMAGAVYTHVAHGEGAQAVVPGILLVLLSLVACARRGSFLRQFSQAESGLPGIEER